MAQRERHQHLEPEAVRRLDTFFGGYFHEDWQECNGTWEGVVEHFCTVHPPQDCALLANDLLTLSTLEESAHTERDFPWWGWLYREFRCYFHPEDVGLSEEQWLQAVSVKLRHHASRAA